MARLRYTRLAMICISKLNSVCLTQRKKLLDKSQDGDIDGGRHIKVHVIFMKHVATVISCIRAAIGG